MIDPQSATTDPAAVRRYLDLIYPPEFGWRGHVTVSHSLPGGTGMPSVRFKRDDDLARQVSEFAASGARRGAPGVYLRCTTVRPDLAGGARGKVGDSVELPGLWADLDIAGPGHRHDPEKFGGLVLPASAEDAAQIVAAAGLPAATAWVHSGGGLYAWWLLGERLEMTGVHLRSVDHWGNVSQAWQARLAEGARSLGYHYGPVGNLDRVLGLVGTMNAKPGTDPRMRTLLSDHGVRYTPQALADAVGDVARVADVERTHWQVNGFTPAPRTASTISTDDHLSPLDDFEQRHSWAQILVPKGWALVKGDAERGGYCEWRHADATHPLSATTGKDPARDRMWNFSSSNGLPTEEPMTKGFVYAALWHGGDMSAAARAVQEIGYGRTGSTPAGAASSPQVGAGNPGTGTDRRLEIVAASSMGGPCASRWLWAEGGAEWLPLGGLCLLGGREGVGKTTMTYRLIGQLTRGTLPGDLFGQPRSAVIAATEDDWRATIIPRLIAASADLTKVYRIDAVEPDRRTGVSMPDDLARLGALLASTPDVAMIVLDPVITVLSARLDSHKDHEVRKALEPVSALAHGLNITVLGLIHDNKSTGTDLATRLMGSRAFVAVARAALVCAEAPTDLDEASRDAQGADPVTGNGRTAPMLASEVEPQRVFLLGQVKSNLGAKVTWSITYEIGARVVGHDQALDKPITGSFIRRTGRHNASLDETMRRAERGGQERAHARSGAQDYLLGVLVPGVETASREAKDGAVDEGHAPATVDRAAADLIARGKIIVTRKGRLSFWSLPATEVPSSVVDIDDVHDATNVRDADDADREASLKGPLGSASPSSASGPPAPARTHAREHRARTQVGAHAGDTLMRISCQCPSGNHFPWCASQSISA